MSTPAYMDSGFGTSPELSIDSLPVMGEVPTWLSGTLLRNGPGTFQVGEQRYRHWFDGLAMLHRFTISDGAVSYSNKFLSTKSYREATETGKIAYSEFATDPCRSFFSRIMSVFDPEVTDSAKVNLAKLADKYVALAETPIQVEFDPKTLESVGVFGWDTSTFGRMTTVHPHIDEASGEAINLVTRFNALSSYCLRRTNLNDPDLATSDLSTMRVGFPSYIHSFGMTKNHIVIAEFPLVVNPLSLLLWLKPYIENFEWRPERGTKFHVFDRHSGKHVQSLTAPAFFAFHHVNAFDDGEDICCDLVAYDDNAIIDAFYLHRLEDPNMSIPRGRLQRFRLSLTSGTVTSRTLSDTSLELPSFEYGALNTNPDLRYVYGIGFHQQMGFYDQLVKIDTTTGTALTWRQEGCYPGEGVLVRKPGSTIQDEGVLLSVVLDSQRGISFLLILDAQSFEEVARVELPHAVLFGYHGQFMRGLTD